MTEDDVRALLGGAPVVESPEVSTWGNPDAQAAIAVWPPAPEAPTWRVVILKQTGTADGAVHAFRAAIEPGWSAGRLSDIDRRRPDLAAVAGRDVVHR